VKSPGTKQRARSQFEQVLAENRLLEGVDVDDILRFMHDDGIETLEQLAQRALDTFRNDATVGAMGDPIDGPLYRNPPKVARPAHSNDSPSPPRVSARHRRR
jgi:hypothetical protein